MSTTGAPPNRLAGEASPYLRLHAHNPVDWYPWGDEALERARAEDRPIFLSVGYSTCYWCHVMERESFSDPAIAELMNRDFVNVKLDREERPDLDEIYMMATQVMTGHGGWPNSVFLTPELKPFYAGTYFPPADRQGLPGFPTVLRSLAAAWRERRGDVEEQAASLAGALERLIEQRAAPAAEPPPADSARRALAELERGFDPDWGGFGSAPKFPTPSNLWLLLELAGEQGGEVAAEPSAARMLATTVDRMARGGLYDQVGGGFHRYATDREWKIPHFEKMLYDNGLLLEVYARHHRLTGDPEAARVVRETAAFLARELTSPEGAFWSALDAETDGREGAFYAWSREALREVLDDEGLAFLGPIYGFDGPPFFEGEYVLHLPLPLAEQAERRRMERRELLAEIEPLRRRLLAARDERPRPLTDDKILADWNGTAIAGLAVAGRLLDEPALVAQAAAAAEFLLGTLRQAGGPLLHSWRDGRAGPAAFLADYAFLIRGLLALERAAGDERWLAAAVELAAELDERLADPAGGYFVAAASPDLLVRSKEVFDGAMPGGNAVAVLDLLTLAERTGEARWGAAASAALAAFAPLVEAHPSAVRALTIAAARYHRLRAARPELFAAGAAGRAAPAEAATGEPVGARLELGERLDDGWRRFSLELSIADGWHLYPPGVDPGLGRPTGLAGHDLELRELALPRGVERRPAPGQPPARLYEERVVLRGELRPAGERPRLELSFQACDERRCLAPASRLLPVASG